MLAVPLQALPSQTVLVTLGGHACQINVYHKRTGLYVDVFLQGVAVITGVIALNANKIVRDAHLGFIGDLGFFDTQGANDPDYTGLGGRYALIYLEVSDL